MWELPILLQIGVVFLFIYLFHRAFCNLVAAITEHLDSGKGGLLLTHGGKLNSQYFAL